MKYPILLALCLTMSAYAGNVMVSTTIQYSDPTSTNWHETGFSASHTVPATNFHQFWVTYLSKATNVAPSGHVYLNQSLLYGDTPNALTNRFGTQSLNLLTTNAQMVRFRPTIAIKFIPDVPAHSPQSPPQASLPSSDSKSPTYSALGNQPDAWPLWFFDRLR